ncbi:hypothetical protein JCGZ_21428 [Jatropha curcas]|uniref:Uncharacterized protein n=1 Tax=Jatropha curcas TaxID=180498 RepID=A0A067JB14_JATCU|nr:hypothetical protein JCGZ_21428 [Jatropha curcas]
MATKGHFLALLVFVSLTLGGGEPDPDPPYVDSYHHEAIMTNMAMAPVTPPDDIASRSFHRRQTHRQHFLGPFWSPPPAPAPPEHGGRDSHHYSSGFNKVNQPYCLGGCAPCQPQPPLCPTNPSPGCSNHLDDKVVNQLALAINEVTEFIKSCRPG